MNARIAKLEGLLERIKTRAAEPRATAVAQAPAPSPVPHDADEESSAEEITLEVNVSQKVAALAPAVPPVEAIEAAPTPSDEVVVDEIAVNEVDEVVDDLDEVEIEEIAVDELDDVELDDSPAPESGPVAASSMDDAIDAAKHQPPMTPPPESGEEIASPQIPAHEGPTMEQLGETIALEEGGPQEFELDEPTIDEPTIDEAPGQLEAPIAAAAPPIDEPLQLPENAQEELARHRLGDTTSIEARVSRRPVISTNVVDLVTTSRTFSPKSFLDLVDSSLSLK